MEWIECALPCAGDAEGLCETLAELGVGGMSVEDEQDFHDFLEKNHQYWDYVDTELEQRFAGVSRVKFWLGDDAAGRAVLETVRAAGYAPETRRIRDEDWENNWRQYYKPIPVGERLVVVPEWETPPEDGRLPLRLDPGLIFGTGSHATTRMCLQALETRCAPGKRVLDLGCGSGILAIGALVLGCESAAGCDIDPKAPDVARANAALNGIAPERFPVYAGNILTDEGLRTRLGGGYDLVLSNIVADVIIPLAPLYRGFMAPGAALVVSGIIDGRQEETRRALEAAGLAVRGTYCQEEWHCFVCE